MPASEFTHLMKVVGYGTMGWSSIYALLSVGFTVGLVVGLALGIGFAIWYINRKASQATLATA